MGEGGPPVIVIVVLLLLLPILTLPLLQFALHSLSLVPVATVAATGAAMV